ncbi:hypothetical protein [Thalassotalea crassostreae]|uniref:Ppx/GppA phosphatase family protein n=1 Tax=Thalassotalea crassostreae TaxID=1763536 RepID=UPI000837F335|nr:hypothetical protein [Thalassotalea crassostreae]
MTNNIAATKTIAVVDLGSNSFHLVLARIVEKDVQILLKEKIKVRLANGLSDDLNLDQSAIERGLKTLETYNQTLLGFHPDDVNIVATYSLRAANNSAEFIEKAKAIIPYPINIISGQEEARLIYQGVAHSVHSVGKRLVIDIGGGSTELAIGEGFETFTLASRNIGCVNLSKRYFADGKITKQRFKQAFLHAEQEIAPIVKTYKNVGWQHCIATSGTASALIEAVNGTIVTGNNNDDHSLNSSANQSSNLNANAILRSQQRLTLEDLKTLKQKLLKFDCFDEIDLKGISDDRKGVIVCGLAVMLAVMKMLDIDSLEYCDKALREGALYEMEEKLQHHDIRERSVMSLRNRVSVDNEQVERVLKTNQILFDGVKQSWSLDKIVDGKLLLDWAANLHEIGVHINSTNSHKHSAYLTEHSTMPGFNQEQQLLLTTLLKHCRKKLKPHELPQFSLYKTDQVCKLVCLFRLSILLNQKRQDNYLVNWHVAAKKEHLILSFEHQWFATKDLFKSILEREQKQFAKVGITLTIEQV